jgi:hypothetical protein
VITAALGHARGRRLLLRLSGTLARDMRRPHLVDYLDGLALNSPFTARDDGEYA